MRFLRHHFSDVIFIGLFFLDFVCVALTCVHDPNIVHVLAADAVTIESDCQFFGASPIHYL